VGRDEYPLIFVDGVYRPMPPVLDAGLSISSREDFMVGTFGVERDELK